MRRGFTLIELIISITIIVLLITGVIVNYTRYIQQQKVHQSALTLRSNLRAAQTKAQSGEKPLSACEILDGYRVIFEPKTETDPASYSIFPVCKEASGTEIPITTEAQTVNFPSGITYLDQSSLPVYSFLTLARGVNITVLGSSENVASVVLTGGNVSYGVTVNKSGAIMDYTPTAE